MGLLDVLTGMRNGPRGGGRSGGGMSPITMALLGLLAYKAVKGFSTSSSSSQPSSSAPQGAAKPGETSSGGGLGEILNSLGMGSSPLARSLSQWPGRYLERRAGRSPQTVPGSRQG